MARGRKGNVMKENCLDIGTIQAFLDGELAQQHTSSVSGHIAACDDCATMLARAENESAIVFPALEREFNTLVPTQRLWNKINESITTERENRTFWQKAFAYLAIAFANPSIAAAAGVLIVVGIFSVVWINRTVEPTNIAQTPVPAKTTVNNISAPPPVVPAPRNDRESSDQPTPGYRVEHAAYRGESRRPVASPAMVTSSNANSNGYLPGEESYVRTISSLRRTVEEKKDDILRPSQRIAYERDMAVVDDAITKMKKEIKRNPKNESARQVLYSSYQNKIDLLNSVSQKEELMVSMR
jgi:hypothetical protein